MNRHLRMLVRIAMAGALACRSGYGAMAADGDAPGWPEIDGTCKPWAYQHWMASAVDKGNLSRELVRYRDAGLGGIHIVPIYGVTGAEQRAIPSSRDSTAASVRVTAIHWLAIWHDASALNAYIARCQSVLRAGAPDNDVLLFWPLFDSGLLGPVHLMAP